MNDEYSFNGSVSTSDKQDILVEGSMSGVESIKLYGNVGPATVEIQTQEYIEDLGDFGPIQTIPEDSGTQTGTFGFKANVGVGTRVYINTTGADASTIFYVKASSI